jgi:apolipoprotein N-acyltransferase
MPLPAATCAPRCGPLATKNKSGHGAAVVEPVNRLKRAARVWPWIASLSSGLLYAACFPPFGYTWLCWVCLTPLIAAIWFSGENSRRRWLRDLLLGYVAGFAFFWTIFSWLTTVTVPGWFLLPFYMGLYFAFWGWFCGLLRSRTAVHAAGSPPAVSRHAPVNKWTQMLGAAGKESSAPQSPWLKSWHNLLLAFLLACVWTAMEWMRSWLLSGWGWNGLGVALHGNWPVIQIAEFTGVAGLSFVVAFTTVIAVTTVLRLILEARHHVMRPHYDVTLTMAAIVGLLAFGWHAAKTPLPSKPVRVAAIQSNIPRAEKFDPQFTQKIFDQFTRLSSVALQSNPPPELLVWPESSMPGPVLQDEATNQFVMDFAATTGTDILLGTIDVDGGNDYNAALLVSDGGRSVQLYRKLHLVPFGEYVPGRHAFPLLARIVGDQVPGDFAVGTDYTVFRLTNSDVRAAPLICFEDTIGELVRRFVLPANGEIGANLLVNVTNDGWFQESAGSRQHLANAIFRCVEMRRPMVRAANTGVTCFVNEFGRVTQILQDETGNTFAEGVLIGEVNVPTGGDLTFYARHGELFAKSCAGITAFALVVLGFLRLARRKTP